jgi:uncharacterized protein YeaO (DUF488 family)
MKHEFRVKRIYEAPTAEDGCRLLVDRLWPRGVKKEAAQIDHWPKELTPSSDLRKWFHEDTTRINEFAKRFTAELTARQDQISEFLQSLNEPVITLVTSTVGTEGHVPVLKRFLERQQASN